MLTIAVSLGSFAQNPDGGAGCMDETACNYCHWATIESGTCDYTCIGCMDENACNYNPDADQEAECAIRCWGCMDENACKWDPSATIDDG